MEKVIEFRLRRLPSVTTMVCEWNSCGSQATYRIAEHINVRLVASRYICSGCIHRFFREVETTVDGPIRYAIEGEKP